MVKKLSAFASIYLLTSKCSVIFLGELPVFAKITRVVFSGLWSETRLSLQIGLSA